MPGLLRDRPDGVQDPSGAVQARWRLGIKPCMGWRSRRTWNKERSHRRKSACPTVRRTRPVECSVDRLRAVLDARGGGHSRRVEDGRDRSCAAEDRLDGVMGRGGRIGRGRRRGDERPFPVYEPGLDGGRRGGRRGSAGAQRSRARPRRGTPSRCVGGRHGRRAGEKLQARKPGARRGGSPGVMPRASRPRGRREHDPRREQREGRHKP